MWYWIIIAGALGGVVRSILGWAQLEEPEPFDGTKFLKSLIRAVIGGAIFGFGVLSGLPELPSIMIILGTFFSAITTDVIWHDAVKAVTKE